MSIKQVDAVVTIVSGLEGFVPGQELTDAQTDECVALLVQGLMSGEIQMGAEARAKHDSEKKMRTYAGGLLSNWLRKSKVLNGGVQYVAKNPGSRSGSAEYKQAVALKKHLVGKGNEVPAELEAYIAANAPVAKVTEKAVEVSALPEHLQKLVG